MTPKAILTVAAVVILALAGWRYTVHQREVGALEVLLKQERKTADSLRAEVKADAEANARLAEKSAADSAALARTRRAIGTVTARTDSAVKVAQSERDRALALVAEPAATVEQLKAEVVVLVNKQAEAEVAHDAERAGWAADTAAANRQIRSLHDEIGCAPLSAVCATPAGYKKEIHDLRGLNASVTDQVALLEKQKPSTLWRWVERGVGVTAIVYLAGKK